MKCINKVRTAAVLSGIAFFFVGCGSSYELPYTADSSISSFRVANFEGSSDTADMFAESLCVVDDDLNVSRLELPEKTAAGLFDLNGKHTIYAKNIHETLYPASLTKVMTAIVALKHGEPDMMLTATANVKIEDSSAQTIGLKEGDTLTLDQALRILLIYSANDAAILIAEGIAGSEEAFVSMMNEEAQRIGATNTHFSNPHGLTDEDHYTTAYDLYLMMNEAVSYSLFNEIIHMSDYQTVYHDRSGNEKEVNIKTTNYYLQGERSAPAGLTVIGGKTGTTSAAGHCLILLSRDTGSNPYISVVMKDSSRDELYNDMTQLLELYSD